MEAGRNCPANYLPITFSPLGLRWPAPAVMARDSRRWRRQGMAERDFDSFMDSPDEFAALPEDQQAALFAGKSIDLDVGSAESVDGDGNEQPGTAPAAEAVPDPDESDKELRDTREQARFWKDMADRQRSDKGAAETTAEDDEKPAEPDEIDLDELEMLADDAVEAGDKDAATELRKQIRDETNRRAEARITERVRAELLAERQAEQDAATRAELNAEAKRVWVEHPSLDLNSKDANPLAVAKVTAVRNFLIESKGLSPAAALKAAVEDVMGKSATAPAPAALTAAQKAAAAIAEAKKPPPTSMGDIPAATVPDRDEDTAVASMTPDELARKMDAMTEEQRELFIRRHT
jgi:hypothetical protein